MRSTFHRLRLLLVGALATVGASMSPTLRAASAACTAHTATTTPPVVELYTSEGCSSCPPADRWLSQLNSDPSVVALAFHVDYWDRLGWKDRFASPAYTERQAQQQAPSGARFSYTPQVIVDGADRPDWPGVRLASRKPAPSTVDVTLVHEGQVFQATISPGSAAPRRLAAYWAVTEQGHASAVEAGENKGATLHHDDVVRQYHPVAAWSSQPAAATLLGFEPTPAADAAHPREINLVIVDADTGRPVQAVKLGC